MPARTKPVTTRHFFSPHGPLSKWHPNYEFRPGQLEMARGRSGARRRKHLIVEAGTGTGKTLAYLVPAILSGKRVVISTGTKNLQEQLYFKDIPFLEQHLGPLRACYMKGRNNYVCRQKIYDAEKEPVLAGLEEVADFEIIREWEKTTETGDRAEIRQLPENSTAWAKIDARRELCTGQKCPQFDRCFITQMHQQATESDIIIVNHHLFFADLAVKEEERGAIIPDYAAVVFDEAHEIEDVAGQYFGISRQQLPVLTTCAAIPPRSLAANTSDRKTSTRPDQLDDRARDSSPSSKASRPLRLHRTRRSCLEEPIATFAPRWKCSPRTWNWPKRPRRGAAADGPGARHDDLRS